MQKKVAGEIFFRSRDGTGCGCCGRAGSNRKKTGGVDEPEPK